MKRIISLILCLALTGACLTGCGSEEPYEPSGGALEEETLPTQETGIAAPGTLEREEDYTLAFYASDGFNPYLCTGINNRMLFSLLYQGLFTVNRDYEAEPILCKSFTVSQDLRTYTITLDNAWFSDGTVLTSADVVASLTAARESELYMGRFDLIDTVTALDSRTVQVVTYYSYEYLPMLLDIPIVKESQVGDPLPLGTGPYSVENTASGTSLKRFDGWWCDAALPLEAVSIPLRSFDSPHAIRDGFEFSDVGISIADPGAASYAEYRCDYELWEQETGIFLYLSCNVNSEVFSNQEVRKALTNAIDRTALLQDCCNGFGVTATLPASPNSPFYDQGLAKTVTFDSVKFEQALADAGALGQTVKLLVNKSDSVRLRTARQVAQMLTDCGLVVEIDEWSTPYIVGRLSMGDYDLYLGQTKLSPTMDLSQFYSPYGEMSYGAMSSGEINDMNGEALENSGNFYNLHQMVLEDGRLVPILFRTYAVFAKRGLASQLEPARDNTFYYSLGKTLDEAMTIEYDQ